MSKIKKRTYTSSSRNEQAALTKDRVLQSAKKLFELDGFEDVTIEKIAKKAEVSIPTVYALFQSKRGVLRALMDEALPSKQFQELVEESMEESSPIRRLELSAKIARQLYEAERAQMNVFRGAAILAPEFQELEKEREMRRYDRQEVTIKAMVKEKSLAKHLTVKRARDILWAFTGRDIYRMFVIEQGWSPHEYEKWLARMLINSLLEITSL
ncbi:MAG: TetR/AcrR family transcriptional regulator [Chlamydiae bacterium]|nr:TetR/AcrR family transcriptional regulator [Chlamydiota bacterium]